MIAILSLTLVLSTFSAQTDAERPRITEPPAGFAPFYKKHLSAQGFPIVASEKVSDVALFEAAYLIDHMLERRPDVRKALIENKVRFAIMAHDELTTDIPEHSDLSPKRYWDRRARGLGATRQRPAVSCGEENLLCFPGDPYVGENILVHEFAHAIHEMGLRKIDPTFDGRLKKAYDDAMREKLWETKYAATNKNEYWAEGVQSYFDTNRLPDHDHNHVRTRKGLEEYDPRLAALIDETFKQTPWRYSKPATRLEMPHLKGYDPAKSPRFSWPAELKKLEPKEKPKSSTSQ